MANCCICTPPGFTFSVSPPNTICATCLQAARSILQLHNCAAEPTPPDFPTFNSLGQGPVNPPPKGLVRALERMEEATKQKVQAPKIQEPSQKVAFLGSLEVAFKTGMHCDVELVADDGQSVRAHRVVMATKSPVFNSMFQVDSCKPADTGPIRIPDLNHNELKCLLEFLYTGNLPQEALKEEHVVHVLLLAADKYDIPFLRNICESRIISTLSRSNVLKVLELSTALPATHMKEMAVRTILTDYEGIIFSQNYEGFAVKNPLLALHVTKALVQDLKSKVADSARPVPVVLNPSLNTFGVGFGVGGGRSPF